MPTFFGAMSILKVVDVQRERLVEKGAEEILVRRVCKG